MSRKRTPPGHGLSELVKNLSAGRPQCPQGFYPVKVVDGYKPLLDQLVIALNQCQAGKGDERHASNAPFLQQPTLQIGRMVGPGGSAQQVMKKTREAMGMFERGEHDAACAELSGAIVYAAMMSILIREKALTDD